MKKIKINNRILNVTDMNDFTKNYEAYNPKLTAIERPDGTVLPVRSKTDTEPGIYYTSPESMVSTVVKPQEGDDEYTTKDIIDLSNPKDIAEIIHKNQLIKDIQNEIMTTPENVLMLKISNNDTPEMRALKDAINSKQVDKRMYEDRFSQFQNDMRLLKGNKITLGKLVSICNAFDIRAELTLKDAEDVPNPMNKEIKIDLTGVGEVDNNDENSETNDI